MTFFGLATADNQVITPTDASPEGIPIYERPTRSGFVVVIEGRPGSSGRPLGTFGTMGNEASGSDRAHLQVLANRPLGNGSSLVCDVGPAPNPIGGVPGVNPIDFGPSQPITDAINDLACRFDVHNTGPTACTLDSLGNFSFASENPTLQTRQFCSVPALGAELALQPGDTLFSVRLQDTSGNIGNIAQMIVRVP